METFDLKTGQLIELLDIYYRFNVMIKSFMKRERSRIVFTSNKITLEIAINLSENLISIP